MRSVTVRTRRSPPGTRRFKKRSRPTTPDQAFALFLDLLRSFVAREGHARVPIRHYEGGHALGARVVKTRTRYRAGELSPERVRALERLPGWTWDAWQAHFDERLDLVREFAEERGHI